MTGQLLVGAFSIGSLAFGLLAIFASKWFNKMNHKGPSWMVNWAGNPTEGRAKLGGAVLIIMGLFGIAEAIWPN